MSRRVGKDVLAQLFFTNVNLKNVICLLRRPDLNTLGRQKWTHSHKVGLADLFTLAPFAGAELF